MLCQSGNLSCWFTSLYFFIVLEAVLFEILKKIKLHRTATLIKVKAPLVVKNAKPGQFVVLRVFESSERIPLTIFDVIKKLEF